MLIAQAKITDGEPASSLIVTPEEARREAKAARSSKPKKDPTP
jgi:hypothetical protein